MNRRGFIRSLAGIGVFSILPGAGRIWKATRSDIGIRAQLLCIDEYQDWCRQGTGIDLQAFFDALYAIRERRGRTADTIEVITDQAGADQAREFNLLLQP